MNNADEQTTHLERLLRSSFPPLNPNGQQPLSMILRGASAELGDLRLALSSTNPTARDHRSLLAAVQWMGLAKSEDEKNDDDDDDDLDARGVLETLDGGHETASENTINDKINAAGTQPTKRTRDIIDDESGVDDDDDEEEDNETLLLYVPSIRCTCASWSMEDVSGELFITSLRVLFLAEHVNDREEPRNDVAIAGRCIALHAVDSLPSSDRDDESVTSHHIYCQLVEPKEDGGDIGYTPAMCVFAPSAVVDEENGMDSSDEDIGEFGDDEGCFEDADTIEIYFKPGAHDGQGDDHKNQSNTCQIIFDALTKLASLNPEEDTDDLCNSGGSGGLLSMLSLMAGMDNVSSGIDVGMAVANDDDDNDDMVFRLGGSNNIVANDDDSSVGAASEDRQAMLRRLDAMLVVPPEYEIASSTDGQFDDADEFDDDEIL